MNACTIAHAFICAGVGTDLSACVGQTISPLLARLSGLILPIARNALSTSFAPSLLIPCRLFAITEWRFQSPSERLPEALFKMRAKAAADPGARTALEQDVELTMRNRFKLLDILDVHDGRAMHADESCR